MRNSPRDRRLIADFQSIQELANDSTIFSFQGTGNPPQRYAMKFNGPGICLNERKEIVKTDRHEVVVELGSAYPRQVPHLAWRTPIFHPNISHNGIVCLGGYGTHWVPSLTLSEMCQMLWDMIRFKNFDTESPYNRDAAYWAKEQRRANPNMFPLDTRSLRDRLSASRVAPPNSFGSIVAAAEVTPVDRSPYSTQLDADNARDVDFRDSEPLKTEIETFDQGVDFDLAEDGIQIIDVRIDRPKGDGDILFID